jgi:hypothetical protein
MSDPKSGRGLFAGLNVGCGYRVDGASVEWRQRARGQLQRYEPRACSAPARPPETERWPGQTVRVPWALAGPGDDLGPALGPGDRCAGDGGRVGGSFDGMHGALRWNRAKADTASALGPTTSAIPADSGDRGPRNARALLPITGINVFDTPGEAINGRFILTTGFRLVCRGSRRFGERHYQRTGSLATRRANSSASRCRSVGPAPRGRPPGTH